MWHKRIIRLIFIFMLSLAAIVTASKYILFYARSTAIDSKLEEKIAYIDALVETMESSEKYSYTTVESRAKVMRPVVQALDRAYGVYACMFDENLHPLMQSARSKSGELFYAFDCKELEQAVKKGSQGRLDAQFNLPAIDNRHKIALYYRWYPENIAAKNRVCLVIGVTSQAIPTIFEDSISLLLLALAITSCGVSAVVFIKEVGEAD